MARLWSFLLPFALALVASVAHAAVVEHTFNVIELVKSIFICACNPFLHFSRMLSKHMHLFDLDLVACRLSMHASLLVRYRSYVHACHHVVTANSFSLVRSLCSVLHQAMQVLTVQ